MRAERRLRQAGEELRPIALLIVRYDVNEKIRNELAARLGTQRREEGTDGKQGA